MIAIRVASAVLAGVSMMSLAACGEETETAAATATTTATASAAATEAAASAAPARNADTVTCEQAERAVKSFKNALLSLAQSGVTEISPTDAKAMLIDLADDLTKASEGASDEVAAALKANIDAALKASNDKDPATAIDSPETAKAGKDLNALCKAAGVETTF
ncbi:hypothetical protein AB0F72_17700 [Actinoplanes sp. NPDC023936]|uniref:hypothetical protein n=1 Tax=Actinoplanes sp. NPDC023936 TaxID=3154910 RepID=UPI0033C76224